MISISLNYHEEKIYILVCRSKMCVNTCTLFSLSVNSKQKIVSGSQHGHNVHVSCWFCMVEKSFSRFSPFPPYLDGYLGRVGILKFSEYF